MKSAFRVAIPAALLLAAATTTTATAAPSATPTPHPTHPKATDTPVTGIAKSTNVCVINATSSTLTVKFERYDTRQKDNDVLPAGAETCAEGTFSSGPDVAGNIRRASGGPVVGFTAMNPSIGTPQLTIFDSTGHKGVCNIHYSSEDAADTRIADDGDLRFTLSRVSDTKWKQFRIRVTPSQSRQWSTCRTKEDPDPWIDILS